MTHIDLRTFVPLAVLFSLLWSSAFIAGAVAVPELGPFLTLVLRFVLGAAIMLPLCLRNVASLLDRATVQTGLLLGALNNGVYLGLTFYALDFISPALVVVCVSCAPFLTTALAALLKLERFTWDKCVGIAVGVIGVMAITGIDVSGQDAIGVTLALLGTVSFAVATVLFRSRSSRSGLLALNFWQAVSGAVVLLPFALLRAHDVATISLRAAAVVLYLTVVVTIGGMVLWMVLIRKGGAANASTVHLLNPVFGVLLSYLFFGTGLELRTLLGAALIGAGLVVVMHGGAESSRHALKAEP
jgi:drug/metabolite transporter (DMT)-like permease